MSDSILKVYHPDAKDPHKWIMIEQVRKDGMIEFYTDGILLRKTKDTEVKK